RWLRPVAETHNDLLFRLDETWTWQYRLTGGYTMRKGVRLSTLAQVDNGFKGQRTVQFAAPTSGRISLPVEPYGASRGSTRTIINLRLTKHFALPTGRFGLQADVFNVLNSNVEWGQNLVSGPTFGYVTAFPDPRVLRFGVSYEF